MPIALEIVSPERLLLSRNVEMVVIPAAEGDMGVLEGHAPMIVLLSGGAISLYEGDRVTERLLVDGGFAEVTPERCTVLANEALPVTEDSRTEAERRLAQAEAEFNQLAPENTEEQLLALERVHSARSLLQAIEDLLSGSH